jgi:putative ABC transport system substrate-binding protein
MRRRALLVVAVAIIIAGPCLAFAAAKPDATDRMALVAVLTPYQPTPSRAEYYEGFREELRVLGWEEGRNLALDFTAAWGSTDDLSQRAAETVRSKPDVIVAAGGLVTVRSLHQATATIPIVVVGAGVDAGASDLIASLARPGGNVTGNTSFNVELSAKRLEILRDAFPHIRRVAVVWNPAIGRSEFFEAVGAAAPGLNIEIDPVEVRSAEQFPQLLSDIESVHADAIAFLPEPAILESHIAETLDLAARARLPAIYPWRSYVTAGGLLSYGPSLSQLFRGAADYVDRILRGASPGDLPIDRPVRFELVINLGAAKALGISVSPAILARVDEVIE